MRTEPGGDSGLAGRVPAGWSGHCAAGVWTGHAAESPPHPPGPGSASAAPGSRLPELPRPPPASCPGPRLLFGPRLLLGIPAPAPGVRRISAPLGPLPGPGPASCSKSRAQPSSR